MTGMSYQALPFSNHSLFAEHSGPLSFILSSLRASFKFLTQLNPSLNYSICLLPVVTALTHRSSSHSQCPFESQVLYMNVTWSRLLSSSRLSLTQGWLPQKPVSLWAPHNKFMHTVSQLAFKSLTDGYWTLFSNSPVKSKKKLLRGSRGQKPWPLS